MEPDTNIAVDPNFEMRRHEPEQPSLFPTEDLIVPETLRSMRKAVSAIHATPAKPEHNQSLNNRRLFDALIMVAQLDCRGKEKSLIPRIKEERLSPMFEVRITDLARLAGIPGKNFERLYEELDQLYSMDFNWNVVGEDNQVEWEWKAHFLSVLGKGQGIKRGLIRFALDPSILVIVLEPSQWATLSLQAMHGLGTGPSYALFQNCWRYINTYNKITAAFPTHVWIKLLVGESRFVKDEGGRTVVDYGEFKRRILNNAIERVNAVPVLGYTLLLKEHKSGNRVSRLQFKFIPKEQESLGLPLTWPEDVLKILDGMGFSSKDIEDMSQAHSFEVVADSIVRLKASETRLRSQGKGISARKAYFEGILRNLTAGAAGEDLDHEKIEAEVRQIELQKAAELRQQKMQEAFADHLRQRFRTWVLLLSTEDREQLIKDYWASDDANPILGKALDKGLSEDNRSALSTLRGWMEKHRPDTIAQIFESPEDKTIEAWMAWKLAGEDAIQG